MPSLYGLIIIAVGIVLVLVALHGATGLQLKPVPTYAPVAPAK